MVAIGREARSLGIGCAVYRAGCSGATKRKESYAGAGKRDDGFGSEPPRSGGGKVWKSLRVFGCLPVTARGAAWRQASEKPRRRKPGGACAGEVSVYGDLRRGSARLGRSRTELPA